MDNTSTYHRIESEIYYIDGILSFLKATRTRLVSAVLLYMLVFVFEYMSGKSRKFTGDCDTLTKQYDEAKKIYEVRQSDSCHINHEESVLPGMPHEAIFPL